MVQSGLCTRARTQSSSDLNPGPTPEPLLLASTMYSFFTLFYYFRPGVCPQAPYVQCLMQFGGRKSFVSSEKLVCFLLLKIRIMQLIVCSFFCLGCQEAQSQIMYSITATKLFLSSYIFVPLFPFLIPF